MLQTVFNYVGANLTEVLSVAVVLSELLGFTRFGGVVKAISVLFKKTK